MSWRKLLEAITCVLCLPLTLFRVHSASPLDCFILVLVFPELGFFVFCLENDRGYS